jgi:hypothetical protein
MITVPELSLPQASTEVSPTPRSHARIVSGTEGARLRIASWFSLLLERWDRRSHDAGSLRRPVSGQQFDYLVRNPPAPLATRKSTGMHWSPAAQPRLISRFRSSKSTTKALAFSLAKASRKSVRSKSAMRAAFSWEISPRSYQCIAAASRSYLANSSGERRKAEKTSSGNSRVTFCIGGSYRSGRILPYLEGSSHVSLWTKPYDRGAIGLDDFVGAAARAGSN